MSRMRHISHHSSHDHESNLDALLEDLQTTVSRSNSQLNLNGAVTSGYREVRRTVTDGTPHGTMREYQIEYVNPANSAQQMVENHGYSSSPSQRHITSYNYSSSQNEHSSGRSDAKLKQNISELDSLLDDLNTAQKKSFSETSTAVTRHGGGIDPGLLEPLTSSTPSGARMLEEKQFREDKMMRSGSPRRELVFTGPRSRDPSPIPVRQQQFYRYEKTTTSRTTGPVMTDMTPDSSQVLRSSNLALEDSGLRNRSPSPGGNRIEYHYSSTSSNNRDGPHSPIDKVSKYKEHHDSTEYSPHRYTSGKTTNSYSYSNNNQTRESRSEVPRSPPPHRSPSPVSFNTPPSPNGKPKGPYAYEPPPPPRSPQPPQRFSPHQQVSSYKYTTTTTNNYHNTNHNVYPEEQPLLPRPFPSPSPTLPLGEQQPPKKLDELMASFSDTEIRNRRNETIHSSHHRYDRDTRDTRDTRETEKVNHSLIPNGHGREKIIEREREKEKQIVKKEESKNMEGPPVYYPPGVELFSKKEESMAQQQDGGGMYKAKAKYEYESKSKSKSKESKGKAVVPVCLPVCCAMPCTIM